MHHYTSEPMISPIVNHHPEPHTMLYLVCHRIARATVPWWIPHHERKDYRAHQRERLADQLFMATWRADQGARHTTASADIHVVGSMARLTRGDIGPAQALRMLFPEDFA